MICLQGRRHVYFVILNPHLLDSKTKIAFVYRYISIKTIQGTIHFDFNLYTLKFGFTIMHCEV